MLVTHCHNQSMAFLYIKQKKEETKKHKNSVHSHSQQDIYHAQYI